LHAAFLLYSVGNINLKLAATSPLFSAGFLINYAAMCALSAVYAVLWQQVLKVLPLNTAYANKSVCIIWGFLWGRIFFGETITLSMITGSVLITAGLLLMVTADAAG